jgi:hypothetical protein
MFAAVQKPKSIQFAESIDKFREHYAKASLSFLRMFSSKSEEARRKSSAIACMTATMVMHDRAVVMEKRVKDATIKSLNDRGMIPEGHRIRFINELPFAVPIVDDPFLKVRHEGL